MQVTEFMQNLSKRWFLLLPIVLLFVFASYRLLVSQSSPASGTVDVSALHLRGLDGRPIPEKEYAGKAIVLNFWAPWCPPCRMEIPWLQELQAKNDQVVVIGVVADPSQYSNAQSFMNTRRVTYHLAENTSSVEEQTGSAEGLPTTLYISAKGQIVHRVTGLIAPVMMQRYVQDAQRN
jgi:thiol-disulfide isomerase/thioredoxin